MTGAVINGELFSPMIIGSSCFRFYYESSEVYKACDFEQLNQRPSYLRKITANKRTMQFISLFVLTVSAIASQVLAGNVAFNVAPLGTREFYLILCTYVLLTDSVIFTS